MLAEELIVLDGDSSLWPTARPLLDAALLLEQNDEKYVWHGWNKQQINAFLQHLPTSCSLILGVWEDILAEDEQDGQNEPVFLNEALKIGVVCEVFEGEVRSIRTFEFLEQAGLRPFKELEPGLDDVLEIMRVARNEIAPVAWALFTDRPTWDEWLFADEQGDVVNKGNVLASFVHKGRCVIMGSEVGHLHQ